LETVLSFHYDIITKESIIFRAEKKEQSEKSIWKLYESHRRCPWEKTKYVIVKF